MARCPFADHNVKGRSPGPYKGGPWKIVLHTTEGSTAAGAIATYRQRGIWPHFTVDGTTIYQHIDTDVAASAVLNRAGGVETNRLSAVQIEMVGFASRAKERPVLESTARLGRWLEDTHRIPRRWPAGHPQGQAGPHNRSMALWVRESGWYGHSQVPENSHWDPGRLSPAELLILMGTGEAMASDRIRVFINDTEQTQRVKSWLKDGNNSVGDYTDLWDYFGWREPEWRDGALYLYTPSHEATNKGRE